MGICQRECQYNLWYNTPMHGVGERFNPKYIHHKIGVSRDYLRELVFGAQDGMVSTLGALTGIAVGLQDHTSIIVAGVAIIAVESISMSIGSYVSSSSEKNVIKRILYEESLEIAQFPEEERNDLYLQYIEGGWSPELAEKMTQEASQDSSLMLTEMAYRQLSIVPRAKSNPVVNALVMFFAYIFGGIVPLSSYFFFTVSEGIMYSVITTLFALFLLGFCMTVFTKQRAIISGVRMLALGSIALIVGSLVGVFVPGAI